MMQGIATLCSSGLLANNMDAQSMLLMAFAILVATMLFWRVNSRRRNAGKIAGLKTRQSSGSATRQGLPLPSAARDEANLLMLKLAELSREICGQIDTRFAKLEYVVAQADRKLAELRRAIDDVERQGESDQIASGDPRHSRIFDMHQDGQTNLDIAREMEMPVGEIELILSLERNRRQPNANADEELAIENEVSGAPEPTATDVRNEDPPPARFDTRA